MMWQASADGWRLFTDDGRGAVLMSIAAEAMPGVRSEVWAETVNEKTVLEYTLTNTTEHMVTLDRVDIHVAGRQGWEVWCWAATNQGFLALSSRSRTEVVRLRRGFLALGDDAVVSLVPDGVTLASGARYRWEGEVSTCDSLADAGQWLPAWLPETVVSEGSLVRIGLVDHAVSAGEDVLVTTDGEGTSLEGTPGTHVVRVAGAHGVTSLEMTWMPSWASVLESIRQKTCSRPAREASDAESLLVVLSVDAVHHDGDDAIEWLESHDWLERGTAWGAAVAGLLGVLTDDMCLVEQAEDELALCPPTVMTELAAARLWMATGMNPARRPCTDHLELVDPDSLVRLLGAGLPGMSLTSSLEQLGQAAALLRFVPDGVPGIEQRMAAIRNIEGRLLARAKDRDSITALAWLALSRI